MAAEFASSAAANAVGNVATEYASPYVGYFFRYRKIVEEFKEKRRQLELKTDRVKNDVDEALRQTEIIEKDVEEWRQKAEEALKETQRLVAEIELQKCFDWCPSWGWRYCLSKKVAKKTLYISQLLQGGDFQRVGIRPPLQGIEFFASKDFQSSESSKSGFDGIMKALNTNGVNMIGLYGMPGVGKTTLAEEVGRQAKEQKLFDRVVKVTMSQTPNISNIQCRIAELLGLKFEASTEEGKAEELWRGLKGVEKILIIIDDVWKEFKLRTIGIPFGVEHEGCKILLTMRLEQICAQMKCQEKFQLDVLSEDEAWALFKDNAGLTDATSTLNDVAKEVASECQGLPLAIVTIGKALEGADLNGWKVACQRLKDSRHLDNEDVCEGLYNRLKLSYDYLKGDDIRSCFLLCSLFPEDFLISIELLIMFGIGHGLFSDTHSIEGFRREIGEVLRKLQDSGLLLKSNEDEYDHVVSMHDVVRDFSHWITSRGEKMFMVKEGLTDWPTSESFGCYTAISFWNSNINNFPDELEFSKLKILVFAGNDFARIPSALVKGIKDLRILYLKNVTFSLEVFQFIRNLRTLYFEDCRLEDISSLKILKNLEILALLKTNIYELPEELEALHGLKSLHFYYYGKQQSNFLLGLLSRLTSLQELHVTCANNINLWELNSLSRLTALSLSVSTDAQCFKENFVFPRLQRYMIAVNESLRYMRGLKFRTLKFNGLSSSLRAFKELFCNVEMLALERIMECKNIVPDIDQEGLNELTDLSVQLCNDMECLMDKTGEKGSINTFSNLTKLDVMDMHCLKELCNGPPPISFLQRVRDVLIDDCKRLKVVFQMDEIIGNEEFSETPLLSNLSSLFLRSLPELESIWKLKSTHQSHASLQSLKDVEIIKCNELKSIFSTGVAQSLLHLQQLVIYKCRGVEEIFDFPQEMAELEEPPLSNLTSLNLFGLFDLEWIWKGPIHFLNLKNLKDVAIDNCRELKSIFSNAVAQSLSHLQRLRISRYKGLEEIFDFPQEMAEIEVPPLSNLTSLDLDGLLELKWIWKGPIHFLNLQNLKDVAIDNCKELKSIFSNGVAQSLLHLRQLRIDDCDRLEEIFDFSQEMAEIEVPPLSNLTSLKLSRLPKLKWIWKGFIHFLNLQNLKVVIINDCNELKSIFSIGIAQSLLHLEQLCIDHCDKLEEIFDFSQEMAKLEVPPLSNLTSLKLSGLPKLKWIWKGSIHFLSLQNLKVVIIDDCNELKSIFSIGVAQSLLHLQQLRVNQCERLEEVFDFPQEMAEIEVPLLSNLTSLRLVFLPKLKWIWKGPTHLGNLKSLKTVTIRSCEELTYLFTTPLAQSLLHLEKVNIRYCDSLEHVIIEEAENDNGIVSNILQHQYPLCFPKLITLKIHDCGSLRYVFPITLAQGLPCLEAVGIKGCYQLEQIFNIKIEKRGRPQQDIVLQRLQTLRLADLLNLDSFCPENYIVMSPCLKELEIVNCPRLTLFKNQQRVAFQAELKDVPAYGIKELLCNAKYVTMGNMTYHKNLIPNVDPEGLNEVTSLELIHGQKLDCLIDTADQAHVLTVVFFNLEELVIRKMTGFKMLCYGPLPKGSLQNLKKVRLIDCGQLQEIFQKEEVLHKIQENGAPLLSNLTHLELKSLPDLKWIWKGPSRYVSLQSLKVAKISRCNGLKYLFSPSLAQSLVLLEKLMIKDCDGLEHIITELETGDNIKSDGGQFLPKLKTLTIRDCPTLKYVLQIPSGQVLPQLVSILINNSPQLKHVFNVARVNNGVDHAAIGFPCLRVLRLTKLTNLDCVCSENYPIVSPSLIHIFVEDCPRFESPVSEINSTKKVN